jgi:uncharacterized protein (DUF2384 family)
MTSSLSAVVATATTALIKHGIEVFETEENFVEWLEKENYFFDKKLPKEFMNTVGGIKFIDDRLTALEYGDNA